MKLKTHFVDILPLVLLGMTGCARRSDFPVLQGPYLGQETPGIKPVIFAPELVSGNAFELHGAFSPDGKEFIFTRRDSTQGVGNRLMSMRLEKGKWTAPEPASFALDCVELLAHISPDGQKVFFLSERAHPVTGKIMTNDEKIWFAEKTESGWGEARFLEGPVNDGWILSVSVVNNGTLYVCGEFGDKGGIFRSVAGENGYQKLEYLFNGVHPYVSQDESFMVFDVYDRSGGSALHVCYRGEGGKWSAPIRLGPEINATDTEGMAEVSPDGKFLFFHRVGDIYWMDARIIEEMKNSMQSL